MKKILVTGGAGYVGSHAAKALAEVGYAPVVYDNLSRGHKSFVKWSPFVRGDLSDHELLVRTLRERQIEAVMHFAAFCYVGESVEKPDLYFQNNVVNTLGLLEAMREADVKQIVFSSTCAVYGDPEKIPLTEDHPKNPVNPYGETKRFIEEALHWHAGSYGLQYVALRYFNAAGADPDGEIGEDHDPETHLIPIAIRAALGKRDHLAVFGTDYDTLDGTAVRDYIHVADLADAHVRALGYLKAGKPNIAINLGTGKGHSVLEVIRAVEKASGKKVVIQKSPRRAGDPPQLVADAKKASQLLRWKPKHSELDQIVETALRWHAKSLLKA
jgi:UDP-arabinose 4-epimerase